MFMHGKMAGAMENIKGVCVLSPEARTACKLSGIFKARNTIKDQGDKTDI